MKGESSPGYPARVLHITDRREWERQRALGGSGFVDPSLEAEGFVHCSTVDQVLIPANERFRGRTGLLLLVVDVALLSSPVRYEDCYASGQEFPHVYGPIDFSAVVATVDFPPEPDGGFLEPPMVREVVAGPAG